MGQETLLAQGQSPQAEASPGIGAPSPGAPSPAAGSPSPEAAGAASSDTGHGVPSGTTEGSASARWATKPGTRWGMVIDVDKCTGCKACMVACRSENNLPTIGPDQVAKGRLMDWINVDRYWEGQYPEVTADFVPMLCQHCQAAPCESVCPVFASMHSTDGMNEQIYPRCVGTRLCASNCPYHVRVFNFFQPRWPAPMEKLLNPDVTVRNEGVMEKCTFCVQRIRRATRDATARGEELHDGELRPACVQSCPTSALVFGRLDDHESAVSRMIHGQEHRGIRVLNEGYHTLPSIVYLRPVREEDVF